MFTFTLQNTFDESVNHVRTAKHIANVRYRALTLLSYLVRWLPYLDSHFLFNPMPLGAIELFHSKVMTNYFNLYLRPVDKKIGNWVGNLVKSSEYHTANDMHSSLYKYSSSRVPRTGLGLTTAKCFFTNQLYTTLPFNTQKNLFKVNIIFVFHLLLNFNSPILNYFIIRQNFVVYPTYFDWSNLKTKYYFNVKCY